MDKKTQKMIDDMKTGKNIHPSKKKFAKEVKKLATNLESLINTLEKE